MNWQESKLLMAILITCGALAAFFALLHLRSFTIDDAYILARYSEHLAEGQGIVWNVGEAPVEGFTSFFLVLWGALFHLMGIEPVISYKIAGISGLVLLVFFSLRILRQMEVSFSVQGGMALAILLSPWLLLHSASGLETILFAGGAILVIWLGLRHLHRLSLTSGFQLGIAAVILTLIRPEGALIGGLAVILVPLLAKRNKIKWKTNLIALLIFILPLAGYELFRLLYFRSLFPNTFYVKQTGLSPKIDNLKDVVLLLWACIPAVILGLVGFLGFLRRKAEDVVFIFLPALVLTGYYITPNLITNFHHRFFAFFIAWVYLFAGLGVSRLLKAIAKRKPLLRKTSTVIIVLCAFIAVLYPLRYFPEMDKFVKVYSQGLQESHIQLGKLLGKNLPQGTLIAVGDAGAIPYFSQLPTLDFMMINDPYLAKNPNPDFDLGLDIDYIFARQPQVIVLVSPQPWKTIHYSGGIRQVSWDISQYPDFDRYRIVASHQFGYELGYHQYNLLVAAIRGNVADDLEQALAGWSCNRTLPLSTGP
jgi:arabinofuranosyltransferase